MAPLLRRTWSRCGQTPILYQRGRSLQKVSAIAALRVSPKRDCVRMYFRLHPDANIHGEEVIALPSRRSSVTSAPCAWCGIICRPIGHV